MGYFSAFWSSSRWTYPFPFAHIWVYNTNASIADDILALECLISPVIRQIVQNIHYNDVIISTMASQLTSCSIVYWNVCLGADQRKFQISASLPYLRGIHRWPVNSPYKGPVMRKMLPLDDVINCALVGLVRETTGYQRFPRRIGYKSRTYVNVMKSSWPLHDSTNCMKIAKPNSKLCGRQNSSPLA